MPTGFKHFGIIGAGAWGTALGNMLSGAHDVTLWAHETEVAAAINRKHENTRFLKGIALKRALKATADLKDLAACDVWILATPAQHTRAIAKKLAALKAKKKPPVLIAAKGIEKKGPALLSDAVGEELPRHAIGILSGPSFADEVARGMPAALTLAIANKALGKKLAAGMATPAFRLYLTDDVVGAQLGGAIKNVLAVACGILTGRRMGENARAAIITRGLAEMMRLGNAMGAETSTLMGLSGLGDLVLTCSSTQSRNMSLGMALGRGQALNAILKSRSSVTEGVYTAAAVLALARKHKVDMPIVAAVDAILNRKANIDAAIAGLLARPLREEGGG